MSRCQQFDDVTVPLSTPVPIPYAGFSFTPMGFNNQTSGSFNELISPCSQCSGFNLVVSPPNALLGAIGDLVIEPYPDPAAHPDLSCRFDVESFAITPSLPQVPPDGPPPSSGAIMRMRGSDGTYKEIFTYKWWAPTTVGRGPAYEVPLFGNEWKGLKWLDIEVRDHANGTDIFYTALGVDDLKVTKRCKCKGHGPTCPGKPY